MPARRTVPAWTSATAFLALLLGVLTGLASLPAPAEAAQAAQAAGHTRSSGKTEATERDPLGVSIDQLTPSTLKANPTKGTVSVSGVVTNDDDETWQDINVHAFIGSSPLTTETELTEASLSDPAQDVGNRITDYGDFSTIPGLAPGESMDFSLTIPRADLRDSDRQTIVAPGVYWFGIQVLGTNLEGRDALADGRARTFLPLVGPVTKKQTPVRAAIVVPLRQRVLRQPDGTLAAPEKWLKRISPDGRLDDLLNFATDHPVSWLVDPAVIDAIQQLADGNPPRNLAPTDGSGADTPSARPSAGSTAARRAVTADTAATAKAWLSRLIAELKRSTVYALPYGDLDLAAAARHDPALYALARTRSAQALKALGVVSSLPADAPVSGYLQAGAVNLGDSSTPLLLSDQAISGTVPAAATLAGRAIVTTSSLVADGGPPPGDRRGLVPVRQELLAQAAMRRSSGEPVIAVMPADWAPEPDGTGFFAGLDQRWLALTTLDGARTMPAEELDASRLHYPDAELAHELPTRAFSAVDELRAAGTRLQNVLTHNGTVATTVLDDALTSASYMARGGHGGAAAERSRESIDSLLRTITVETPSSVTLSSDKGRFSATVINGLDQPITVKVRPIADRGMTISAPRKLEIPANGHAGVPLRAKARTNGVHTVVLQLTDTSDSPLGSAASFPIRTAQVSRIIWLFIGGGVGLLFAAIVVRLVRRLRSGGGEGDDGPDGGDPEAPETAPDLDPADVEAPTEGR